MAKNSEFGSVVSKWVKKTERRMEAVWKESTKRVVSEAQRLIPVDTGFARASIRASLGSMPPPALAETVTIPQRGRSWDQGAVLTVIASAKLSDRIFIGWTANYAIFLEYGHSKQAPSGFVRVAAMQWKRIVGEVSAELKSRVEGTS